MKTGALLSAIASLASVQVAAIPQPNNIWQRLGGILEQRQEAASSSSHTDATPAPTLAASYAPIVSTVVETITGKPNATIAAIPATTVGPSLSEDSFTTTSGFLFTRTASDGEVCVISVNRTDVYITIHENRPHTAYVTRNGSSSSSPALYGNGTTSATALYPTGNGTASSFGVGPTGTAASPSYVNATTTTSSLSLILTTGASSGVVVLPSGTGLYANSTSFAAPTSAPVVNTTESSSVAFANSTATAAPLTSTSSAYVYANATASSSVAFANSTSTSETVAPTSYANATESSSVAFANSTATAGPTSEPVASASSTHTYANATGSSSVPEPSSTGSVNVTAPTSTYVYANATKSSAVPAFSSASVVFVNTTSATVTERTTETLTSAALSSSTFAAFLNTTEPKTTVTLTRTQLSTLSTDASSFTTFTRSFPQVTPIPATTARASTSDPLVIATTMTAVVTGPIVSTSLPATVANITATVTGDRHHHHHTGWHAPQPTMAPGTQYCNVQGAPLGVFYMASYYYNSMNVDVTLEGCYQFCTRSHVGCEAYAFHARDGLQGSSVCDVYSASVTHALSKIDDSVEDLWFDASCGDPLKYIS